MKTRIQNSIIKNKKIEFADANCSVQQLDDQRLEFIPELTHRKYDRKRIRFTPGCIIETDFGNFLITEIWQEKSPSFMHLIAQPTSDFAEPYSEHTQDILHKSTSLSETEIKDIIKGLASQLSLRSTTA